MDSIILTVSGKVQGVFFRANVRRKAEELGLKGYAKNLENGDVEIAAEGYPESINELIRFIKSNPGASRVKNVEIARYKHKNFKNFGVL